MELKTYKIIINNDIPINYAKQEIIRQLLTDINDNSINTFRFRVEQDKITRLNCLICETKQLDEYVACIKSYKTETPAKTIWKISESKKPKFWERLRLALKFIFKKDKAYFEQVCTEHKAEIEKLSNGEK